MNCGNFFSNGGLFVESFWCWKKAYAATRSPQIQATVLQREGRMLECLGSFQKAMETYQSLIDQHLFTENVMAREVQLRLDELVRDHSSASEKKRSEARDLELERALALVSLARSSEPFVAVSDVYVRTVGLADDGHGHCPMNYSLKSNATLMSKAPEMLARLIANLQDADAATRQEAAATLIALAKDGIGGTREIGGIGAAIERPDQDLIVRKVLTGMPAALAGLQAGDVILSINQTAAGSVTTTEAVTLLRGAPGSEVTVRLRRGSQKEPLDVRLTRQVVTRVNVDDLMARILSTALQSNDPRVREKGVEACAILGERAPAACKAQEAEPSQKL